MTPATDAPFLSRWGWSAPELPDTPGELARVVAQRRGSLLVVTAAGDRESVVSGRFRHEALRPLDFPLVGDWVLLDAQGVLTRVLPRRTVLVRKAAGAEETQGIAANVDDVLVVSSLDGDVNARRLERYLAAILASGATPHVVLTKADLAEDLPATLDEIAGVTAGVDTLVVSVVTGEGMDVLAAIAAPGRTCALVGSSGAGKSTLANALGGLSIATRPVSEPGRGRHTTTMRELHALPSGALLLDTPGMREFGLASDEGVDQAFAEIDEAAAQCAFGDCAHDTEPGCAVREAVATGAIEPDRLDAYLALRAEGAANAARLDPLLRQEQRAKAKILGRAKKAFLKDRGR